MIDRARIAANAAGSLRLEGLEPSRSARDLVERWVRGDASDADLREAERRLLSGEPIEPQRNTEASVAAMQGDETQLRELLAEITAPMT